jgi:hypothetical protein
MGQDPPTPSFGPWLSPKVQEATFRGSKKTVWAPRKVLQEVRVPVPGYPVIPSYLKLGVIFFDASTRPRRGPGQRHL